MKVNLAKVSRIILKNEKGEIVDNFELTGASSTQTNGEIKLTLIKKTLK